MLLIGFAGIVFARRRAKGNRR